MLRIRSRTVRALGAAAALALPSIARAQDVGLAIGSTPAAATVEDLDGNPVDLSQFVGKKPLLVQFWATWCPLCKELEPQMNELRQKYGDRIEILIIAVGVNQNPRTIRRHIAQHPPAGRVLYDAKGAAVRAFQAPTTSYVAILDANGKVVYTGTGGDQPLLATVAKVTGAGAGAG